MIEHIISTAYKLVEIYEDKDNARKDELAAIGGKTATSTNVFSAFYDRLKEIREYHKRHPAARVVDAGEEYEQMFKEDQILDFSGEVHQFKIWWTNRVHSLSCGFVTAASDSSKTKDDKALAALGLKTGGTVQQRAERLFLTKNTPLEKLDRKHFAKPPHGHGSEKNGNVPDHKQEDLKELALTEAKMRKLCELLHETIVRLGENTVKKQGQTWKECTGEHQEEKFCVLPSLLFLISFCYNRLSCC